MKKKSKKMSHSKQWQIIIFSVIFLAIFVGLFLLGMYGTAVGKAMMGLAP